MHVSSFSFSCLSAFSPCASKLVGFTLTYFVAWETLMLAWAYNVWKNNREGATNQPRIVTTNYPIYLCRHWLKEKSKKKSAVEFPNPGSVDSLWEPADEDFRGIFENLLNNHGYKDAPELPAHMQDEDGKEDARRAIAALLAKNWELFSFARGSDFGLDTNAITEGFVDFRNQTMRVVRIDQWDDDAKLVTLKNASMASVTSNDCHHVDTARCSLPPRATTTIHPKADAQPDKPPGFPGRNETKGNPMHENRLYCSRGGFVGDKTFQCLTRDNNNNGAGKTGRDGVSSLAGGNAARALARLGATPSAKPKADLKTADSLYFVVASDATVVSPPEGGTHRVASGHLDWFMGDLHTGAIVFASNPPPDGGPPPLPVTKMHPTDDISMYLMKCVGDDTDSECHVGAMACVGSDGLVKINGFQVQTKLRYIWTDKSKASTSAFFTASLVFSSSNNDYAFDLTSADWPNFSATDSTGDPVSAAHTLCMGLGEKLGISDEARVTGDEILGFLDLLPAAGPLDILAGLTSFTLDTSGRGRKNALWFSPVPRYETSLRLCFQHADSPASSLLDTIKTFLVDVTNINLDDIEVTKSFLVAKKSWTRLSPRSVQVEGEVTAYTEVKITKRDTADPSKNVTLTFETALVLSANKVEWVLNIPTASFKTLVEFIVAVFTGGDLPDFGTYLPGADKIALRRLVYTSSTEVDAKNPQRSVEIILQVSFAGLTMICSVYFDLSSRGGASFRFSGNLFPDNRPHIMGPDFHWIPFMPRYEPWTALQLMTPLHNAFGVLEDVGGSDVGDLKAVYNTLGQTLGKSLTGSFPMGLELVGLSFALTNSEVMFEAIITSDATMGGGAVPRITLEAARLDLRYDFGSKEISNCGISTSIAMTSTDSKVPPVKWNLALRYDNSLWTVSGGINGLRGSMLYSLFDSDCNQEMMQLLSNIVFDLQLEYHYDAQAKGSDFTAQGRIRLGHLRLDATYRHNGNSDWSLVASLAIESEASSRRRLGYSSDDGDEPVPSGGGLGGIVRSICGDEVASMLPDCVSKIDINPVKDKDLTTLTVVKTPDALIVLVRLQITNSTCVAFYQYQQKRPPNADKTTIAPTAKRMLIFSVSNLPEVPKIPLVGTLSQPFDELRFLWVSGDPGWTKKEADAVNAALAKQPKNGDGYPRISYKASPTGSPKPSREFEAEAEKDVPVLKSGGHFCIIQGGETRLDYAFGGNQQKKKKKKPGSKSFSTEEEVTPMSATTPVNKTFGPVTILGVGIGFDMGTQTLKLALDGTVKMGPVELTLLGFSVSFNLKGATLQNFTAMEARPTFQLDGLGISFQKDPLTIAGLFEHKIIGEGTPQKTDMYVGGAIVGFKQWMLEAGGFYGTTTATKKKAPARIALGPGGKPLFVLTVDEFKSFMAYVRVMGPIATIGYVEIRGVVGGFGYNTSIRTPKMENVMDFPFLASKPKASPSEALASMLAGGWFTPKQGENWVAVGLTVLAFQTLSVQAVVVVEWGSGTRLGIYGLATAEMPKQLDFKFAVVQLGVTATIDFDAGTLKVDGQLTPASFILDPSCHLTGGFALYAWFGPGEFQGDWVFTIGGFHPAYQKPTQYPNPPRLGISWSFDSNINIVGKSYFAITPKACMGGGSLHVTLSVGPLYAYLDAYADFLINYRPFMYMAQGGIGVGVHFTLDLWLVTISINVDISAVITLRGPPLSGTVHVDFYVFGFDVNFGAKSNRVNDPILLGEFYTLALQTASSGDGKPTLALPGLDHDDLGPVDETDDPPPPPPPPHILNCISGLVPQTKPPADGTVVGQADVKKWVVRGAVFAFNVSCKFAVKDAVVQTLGTAAPSGPGGKPPPVQHEFDVENKAAGTVYAKPMQRTTPWGQSHLQVAIEPPQRPVSLAALVGTEKAGTRNWTNVEAQYSNLPTALWGKCKSLAFHSAVVLW